MPGCFVVRSRPLALAGLGARPALRPVKLALARRLGAIPRPRRAFTAIAVASCCGTIETTLRRSAIAPRNVWPLGPMRGFRTVRTRRPPAPRGRAPSLGPEGIRLTPTRAGSKCAPAALASVLTSTAFRRRFGRGAASTARDMRSTAMVRPLRSWVALRSTRFRVVVASAAISARKAETCLRRRSGVDGFGGARRGAASPSERLSPRLAPRSGRPGIARLGPRLSRGGPLRVRGRSPDPPFGGGSMAMVSGGSKSTFASLASFTPSWSRSTRVRTSITSASGRSPSSNGPNETRISRLTARPRCSRIFLISRFFPSLRPKVSQAFAPCSRSSLASTPR